MKYYDAELINKLNAEEEAEDVQVLPGVYLSKEDAKGNDDYDNEQDLW